MNEWKVTGEELIPFVLEFDCTDFKNYLKQLKEFKAGVGIPDNFVPLPHFVL